MMLKANVLEALRSLSGAKQRTILALIGIVIGIGSVIGMVSIGAIAEHEVLKQFQDMGVDVAMVRAKRSDRNLEMTLKQVLDLPKQVPAVLEVAPFVSSEENYGHGLDKFDLVRLGVTESFFHLNRIRAREGRLVSDLDEYRYFCVVGKGTAENLRRQGMEKVLGSRIALGDRFFTIVGILETVTDGGMRPYGINASAIMHITTAGRSVQPGPLGDIMVRLDGKRPLEESKAEIERYFERTGAGLPVTVRTAEEIITGMKKQMQLFSLLLGAVGSIALIVGGIGVMNVMLISVMERRREIGLRRALGARQRDIQMQFITESVTLCLLGGILGILLGVTVSFFFALVSQWAFLVSYGSIALGFGVAASVGIFFGYYPARTAARLDPIRALRS